MFTGEQILELYFKRDERAVAMTSQIYQPQLLRQFLLLVFWEQKWCGLETV